MRRDGTWEKPNYAAPTGCVKGHMNFILRNILRLGNINENSS